MKYKRYKIVAELEMSNDTNLIRNLINTIEEHLGIRVVTCKGELLDQEQEQKKGKCYLCEKVGSGRLAVVGFNSVNDEVYKEFVCNNCIVCS